MKSMKFIRTFGTEEIGQSLTEYTLLIAFATVFVVVGYSKSLAGITNTVNSNLVAAANFAK